MDYPILEIIWVDAETFGGTEWNSLEDAMDNALKPPPTMRTVGYLLHETEEYYAVTDSIGPEECGCVNKIPRHMLISVCKLNDTSGLR